MDNRAIQIVLSYIAEHLDKTDPTPDFTVFTVWKAKVLQNWKYLLSSTLCDGMYYELTYNGDKLEWYLDAYKKFENQCIAAIKPISDYKGEWCLESFHPLVVRWAWKNIPGITRGLLVGGPAKKGEELAFIKNTIAHLLVDFLCRPQFIAYDHRDRNLALRIVKKLGAFSVMWTVDNEKDHSILEKEEDTIIFEHYLPKRYLDK